MSHSYFSQRTGVNPHIEGQALPIVIDIFVRVFKQFQQDGYFDEAFGFDCTDEGHIDGLIRDVDLEIQLTIRKQMLWPITTKHTIYSEDDFFDIIEFLYQHVSKPIDGYLHTWNGCGMHWNTFDQNEGRIAFRNKVNTIFDTYEKRFELSADGHVLHKPEEGLEPIIKKQILSTDSNIGDRVNAAKILYQRHKSSIVDRRHAVSELANVLEYLRPQMRSVLDKKDEADLFNIANNFGIRHHNDKQKTDYDEPLWLGWMFYFYLITIHVVLRKLNSEHSSENVQK